MIQEPIKILNKIWGFDQFRGSQKEIIEAVLKGEDVLALMPTAGGKSICYQIPALIRPGICIVVSPLVALIQDQVAQLKMKGVRAIELTGGISFEELIKQLDNCIYGSYKFLYLSPERIQQSIVQERISEMPVNLIAIDEAHCISQWGHDFRPAYLQCSVLRELKPEINMIALTATATERVAKDITTNLKFRGTTFFKDSFLRRNIVYKVVKDENKRLRLTELCQRVTKSGIIYTGTRRNTSELAAFLNRKGISSDFFHGGLPKEEKAAKLRSWMDNKVKLMVATNAFGMGVDKPDVELVVHYQIPDCIENYYQEAGRAGRDGASAAAVLIFSPGDELKAREQFLETLPGPSFLKNLYRKLNNYFQISYGEGKDTLFRFNFNDFCEVYKLNSLMVYNSLKILDQYSVISLSQSFSRRSHLQFKVGKNELMSYLGKNQDIATLVQNILRTYGGIFDFRTKINTHLVAKKSGLEEEAVLRALEQLDKDNIVNYEAGHFDLEITFLVPREDDITINSFSRELKSLQQLKTGKLNAMIAYIQNSGVCRRIQLLNYFGEIRNEPCGECDVCREAQKSDYADDRQVERDILIELETAQKTSRQIVNSLPYEEKEILLMLQKLLEEERIAVNSKNEYLRLS